MTVKYPLDSAALDGCGFDNSEYAIGVPDVSVNMDDNGQAVVLLLGKNIVLPTWDEGNTDKATGVAITPLRLCTITFSAAVSVVIVFDVIARAFDIDEMFVDRIGVAFDRAKTELVKVDSCVACEVIALDWLAISAFRLLNEIVVGDIYYKSINILDQSSFNQNNC